MHLVNRRILRIFLFIQCIAPVVFSQDESHFSTIFMNRTDDLQLSEETKVSIEIVNSNKILENPLSIDSLANIDMNDNSFANITQGNTVNEVSEQTNSTETKKIIACRSMLENSTLEERQAQTVELINGTRLTELLMPDSEITTKETEAHCMIVLFYSRLCPFSIMFSPHFNALARSFPDLKLVALDALKYHGVNTQYGIVGVPTVILFHNGRPVAKFNGTEYTIQAVVKFVKTYTAITEDTITMHSRDFRGPVPCAMDKEIDYYLVLSWGFIISCAFYFFSKSIWCKKIVELIQNNWREAEAQREHID